MNTIMEDYYPLFRLYQDLRAQLLAILTDEDLAFTIQGNESLGALCVRIGEVQQDYINSFRDLSLEFTAKAADDNLSTSVLALKNWYDGLDAALETVIAGFKDSDLASQEIDRGGGFVVPIHINLDIYKEALIIFCGKARVYLNAMGKPLPEQWLHWIE
jgi:hypothetical protein